jgi:predicted secreted Zn-dependent protease
LNIHELKRILFIQFLLILLLACGGTMPNTTGTAPAFTSIASVEIQGTATTAPAPTSVTIVDIQNASITYYDISGSTGQEMRTQLDRSAPVAPDGYRGDATTIWNIYWTWDGYGTEDCDLETVKTTYDIQVTMPRWTPPKDASPELVEEWNRYILALTEHEQVHVDHVIAGIPGVINAIRNASCGTAESEAQAVLDDIRQKDDEYDATTNHGAAQGAVFPPLP